MKFKLPRQVLDPEIVKIAKREIKKQKIEVLRAGKKIQKELAEICKAIKDKGLPDYLVCKKLPNGLGSGIFLHPEAKPILKGKIIGTYSGNVSILSQTAPDDSAYAFAPIVDIQLSKAEQAYFDPTRSYHPKRLYALDVDAIKTGNFTRFINHSAKPNIVAHLYKIPTNSFDLTPSPVEVIYLARKTIRPGEQLLVSYEGDDKSYWSYLKIKPAPITPRTFLLSPSLKVIQTKNFT